MAYEYSCGGHNWEDTAVKNKKDDYQGVTEPCKSSGLDSYDREKESVSAVHETPFVAKASSWIKGTVASQSQSVIEGASSKSSSPGRGNHPALEAHIVADYTAQETNTLRPGKNATVDQCESPQS